ncbi:MAG: hypothetical protein O7A04_10910 [Acidobacteria bacterium]|nr:hypothetical protein [Acidobacteriota bacterium]
MFQHVDTSVDSVTRWRISATAERIGLDRRTVKSRVDRELLVELRGAR